MRPAPRAVVLSPGGVEERGFAGKNILADQLNRYHLYDFYNFPNTSGGQLQWGDAIFLPA